MLSSEDIINKYNIYNSIAYTNAIKNFWYMGFSLGEVIVDLSEEKEARYIQYALHTMLANYRLHVRKFKLNPFYNQEWKRIEQCKLIKTRDNKVIIRLKHELLLKRQIKKQILRLQDFWNSVPLTKSEKLPNA